MICPKFEQGATGNYGLATNRLFCIRKRRPTKTDDLFPNINLLCRREITYYIPPRSNKSQTKLLWYDKISKTDTCGVVIFIDGVIYEYLHNINCLFMN